MKLFGADFSGAGNPSRGIYYAEGRLDDGTLHIERVVHVSGEISLTTAI